MEKQAQPKDPHQRHAVLWKILRPVARVVCWLKFGYWGHKARVKGPFLLVSNHNTNWDPILVGCSFPEIVYFVSSEHVLRSRPWGRLIRWAMILRASAAVGQISVSHSFCSSHGSAANLPEACRTIKSAFMLISPARTCACA